MWRDQGSAPFLTTASSIWKDCPSVFANMLTQCDSQCAVTAFSYSVLTRRVGLGGFVVLIWDHATTLEDEIEYVWRSDRKHYFFWLFLLNRYLIPLSFVVNTFAYFSHVWDYHSCKKFVVYEGVMTMVGIVISNIMMLYRLTALYASRHRRYHYVVFIAGTLVLAFVGINTWLLTHATPIFVKAPYTISCTMVFNTSNYIASSSAWLPLLYGTTVVGLTVYRTFPYVRRDTVTAVMRRLLEEGLLYYTVIFSVTFTLTIMILVAPTSTKNIAAQLELLLTATMMSHITIDLKRFARKGRGTEDGYFRSPVSSNLVWRVAASAPAHVLGHGNTERLGRDAGILAAIPPEASGEKVFEMQDRDIKGKDSSAATQTVRGARKISVEEERIEYADV